VEIWLKVIDVSCSGRLAIRDINGRYPRYCVKVLVMALRMLHCTAESDNKKSQARAVSRRCGLEYAPKRTNDELFELYLDRAAKD
jgi:hypothetical protein